MNSTTDSKGKGAVINGGGSAVGLARALLRSLGAQPLTLKARLRGLRPKDTLYRLPSTVSYTDPATKVTTDPYPYDFNPLEEGKEEDFQVNAGFKVHQCYIGFEFTVKLHSLLARRCLPDQLHVGLRGNQGPDPGAQQWMVVH